MSKRGQEKNSGDIQRVFVYVATFLWDENKKNWWLNTFYISKVLLWLMLWNCSSWVSLATTTIWLTLWQQLFIRPASAPPMHHLFAHFCTLQRLLRTHGWLYKDFFPVLYSLWYKRKFANTLLLVLLIKNFLFRWQKRQIQYQFTPWKAIWCTFVFFGSHFKVCSFYVFLTEV